MQQSYAIDSFGNMSQSGTLNSQLSFDANNRITSSGYGYDAAGNTTSFFSPVTANTSMASYDAESKIFTNSGGGYFTYDTVGERMRKDANGAYTEYQYLNGQPIAEKHPDGSWSDYVYANGQKIARADDYDVRIHFSGTNCSNCGPQAWAYDIPVPLNVIQAGDKIAWRQYQGGPAVPRGGLAIQFTDGTNTNWQTNDQDGQQMNNDATQNAWHFRVADLSAYVGKTISVAWINEDTGSGAGNWDEYFSDITFIRADGTVQPIYHRQTGVSYSGWGSSGVSNQKFEINTNYPSVGDAEGAWTVTYYVGDQIGSVREELGGEGWPVSSDTFYPFGQEQSLTTDPNHYKFTGKERDTESGLDYFGARYYSSSMGRWMNPDWADKPEAVPYSDLVNPQSLNLYGYVQNNPLRLFDPDGHFGLNNDAPGICNGSPQCLTDSQKLQAAQRGPNSRAALQRQRKPALKAQVQSPPRKSVMYGSTHMEVAQRNEVLSSQQCHKTLQRLTEAERC